jgi:hypothetical protein
MAIWKNNQGSEIMRGAVASERVLDAKKGVPGRKARLDIALTEATGIVPKEFLIAVMRDETCCLRKLNPADRIACFHMSGLSMLSHMTAGQDGFRGASSNQSERSRYAAGLPGMSRVLDRSRHLLLILQAPNQRSGATRPADPYAVRVPCAAS